MGIWLPDTLPQRSEMCTELEGVARRLDDPRLSVGTAVRAAIVGMESGNREQVESALALMRKQADSVPEPAMSWLHLLYESGWSCVKGELETSESTGIKAFEIGKASGQPDAVAAFGMHLVQIRFFQGRTSELVEQSVRLARRPGSHWLYRAAGALALVESGRDAEALELAGSEDLWASPWDWHWLWAMFIWAHVCCRLDLADRQRELYGLLTPFSRQLAGSGSSAWGSVAWALGTIANALGRFEDAEAHFRSAAEIEEGIGAPLLLGRTHVGWARAIIARGNPDDLPRAMRMLDDAEATAARLGGALVVREVAESRVFASSRG